MNLLDLGLLIGVLLQFGKASDLLLSNAQKKAVQEYCEDFALKIDDARPIEVFWRIYSERRIKILLAICAMVLVGFVVWNSYTESSQTEGLVGTKLFAYFGFVVLFLSATTICVDYLYGKRLSTWLYGHTNFLKYLKRYLLVVFGFAALLQPLVVFILFGLDSVLAMREHSPVASHSILLLAVLYMLPVLLFSTYWWALTVTGYVLIASQLILSIAQLILWFWRALMWRIVEFNKGAWAAITLLVTIALGITKIVFT